MAGPEGYLGLEIALGVGIARRAEGRDEEVRVVHLARHRIEAPCRQPNRQTACRPPRASAASSVRGAFAIRHKARRSGIPVALDMLGAMLLPQDHQRHAAIIAIRCAC